MRGEVAVCSSDLRSGTVKIAKSSRFGVNDERVTAVQASTVFTTGLDSVHCQRNVNVCQNKRPVVVCAFDWAYVC
jgi:hypothetical protein